MRHDHLSFPKTIHLTILSDGALERRLHERDLESTPPLRPRQYV